MLLGWGVRGVGGWGWMVGRCGWTVGGRWVVGVGWWGGVAGGTLVRRAADMLTTDTLLS